jgi:hypothetical protein
MAVAGSKTSPTPASARGFVQLAPMAMDKADLPLRRGPERRLFDQAYVAALECGVTAGAELSPWR